MFLNRFSLLDARQEKISSMTLTSCFLFLDMLCNFPNIYRMAKKNHIENCSWTPICHTENHILITSLDSKPQTCHKLNSQHSHYAFILILLMLRKSGNKRHCAGIWQRESKFKIASRKPRL